MRCKNNFWVLIILLILLSFFPNITLGQDFNQEKIGAVYLTGIGCPNCSQVDFELLVEYTKKIPDLIIIEYEVYQLQDSNMQIAKDYFNNYFPDLSAGIPALIFNKNHAEVGKLDILEAEARIKLLAYNHFLLPDGTIVDFKDIDLTNLPGEVKIWTKNRVLIEGNKGNNKLLKRLLTVDDISSVLKEIEYENIPAKSVQISGGQIEFSDAVLVGDWILQWNEQTSLLDEIAGEHLAINMIEEVDQRNESNINLFYSLFIIVLFLFLLFIFIRYYLQKKDKPAVVFIKIINYSITLFFLLLIIVIIFLVQNIPYDTMKKLGSTMSLPVFTFFIALIDGFNPCNLFVLTYLLGLLISVARSRKKIFVIGYTFIAVVFIIYFLFLAAWLNIFKFIGFLTPLRIIIGVIALFVGVINCKELFAFRKGITLMVQERHKGPLYRKIRLMKEKIIDSSTPVLALSSISLAVFASLVELPCTAGFPIIYTGILTTQVMADTFFYFSYLLLYSFVYILPLVVITTIFTFTFKGRQISKKQIQIMKFVGGLIMVLSGIILLFNPALVGILF